MDSSYLEVSVLFQFVCAQAYVHVLHTRAKFLSTLKQNLAIKSSKFLFQGLPDGGTWTSKDSRQLE